MTTMLRLTDVMTRVGLSRSKIYALVKSGQFPLAIPLSGRSVAWVESEVESWLQDRIQASRGGAKR